MTFDADNIKKDFPMFENNPDMVYLDTAATSLTVKPSLKAVREYFTEYRATTHRGLYASAERATAEYEGARAKVAKFVGADAEEVVFTSGATASSNMLVYALEASLGLNPDDEIVTTVMEHHAALLPLRELAKRKELVLKTAQLDKDFTLDYADLEELITDRTKIVSVTLASNVTGSINDVARTAKKVHAVGAVLVVDATAAVGHMPVDVRVLDADYLYFSGHKMCGPTGIGILYGKKELLKELAPGFYGGGMVDAVSGEEVEWSESPAKFEAGTPHVAGAIGLGATVEYLSNIGMDMVHEYVRELVTYASQSLGTLEGVTLYAAKPEQNVGIISFTVEGVHPHDMAQIAADEGVAVRAGHHCAIPLTEALGVNATTRASFYLYNTKDDVDALVQTVQKAQKTFAD